MRAAARNAACDQYGLKDGLNRVATLHFVEVLILSPNSWKVESAKSPLVCHAGDGSPEGAGGDEAIRHNARRRTIRTARPSGRRSRQTSPFLVPQKRASGCECWQAGSLCRIRHNQPALTNLLNNNRGMRHIRAFIAHIAHEIGHLILRTTTHAEEADIHGSRPAPS
jgi:hypothetical protein